MNLLHCLLYHFGDLKTALVLLWCFKPISTKPVISGLPIQIILTLDQPVLALFTKCQESLAWQLLDWRFYKVLGLNLHLYPTGLCGRSCVHWVKNHGSMKHFGQRLRGTQYCHMSMLVCNGELLIKPLWQKLPHSLCF